VTGIVESILNHGTIVQLFVRDDDGGLEVVNCDHRMFEHMFEGEDGDILGRTVEVTEGDGFGDEIVEFLS
jgi:hypothetical protein